MSKSMHWYDRDGKAVFEVPKAKGDGMRATTIADARKLNLYPSVTTVLSVIAKPSLDESELSDIINTGTATILELTIARALLNGAKRGSLYAIESLLNRAVGLPRVTQDVNIEQRSFNITMSLE